MRTGCHYLICLSVCVCACVWHWIHYKLPYRRNFSQSLSTKHRTKSLTHQTGNYPVTCFVSRLSGITLVKFHSLQVTIKTNLVAELKHQAPKHWIRRFYWLRELYEADFHKPGIYGRGRVLANAWDVGFRAPSRGGRGRRAAVAFVVCFVWVGRISFPCFFHELHF